MRLVVRRVPIPDGFDGRLSRALGRSRVALLSDLHVRGTGPRERRLARRLAELEPDLLLMTGDFGDRGTEVELEALRRLVGTSRPPLGAYAVLGNNDYFRGANQRITEALRESGVRVLFNESVVIEAPHGRIAIAGVDDPYFGRDEVSAALSGIDPGVPVILLAHSPEILRDGRSRGILVNAGDSAGAWGRGWFWVDGSHVREEPDVMFPTTGLRRLRVPRREDGVTVDEIRLVPATGAADGTGRSPGRTPPASPGAIIIEAKDVDERDVHGEWRLGSVGDRLALIDGPDRGGKREYPEAEPASYFEAVFEALGGVRYRVWVHLRSPSRRGTSDSLYVQFSDSLDPQGRPAFRSGEALPGIGEGRVDLVLAGHTHGGQVRLPLVGGIEPSVRESPFDRGLYEIGNTTLFVSSGVGWSWLPVRLACPPEIVLFETD